MRRSLLVASKDDVRKRTDPRAGVGRVGLSGRYDFRAKSNGGLSLAFDLDRQTHSCRSWHTCPGSELGSS